MGAAAVLPLALPVPVFAQGARDVPAQLGPAHGGPRQDGAMRDSPAHGGAAQDRPMQDISAQTGAMQDGPMQDVSVQAGAGHDDAMQDGPTQDNPMQDGAIEAPLTGVPGDPARGRAVVVDRQKGLCLLCHSGPFPEQRFQGNLAPDLGGTGARWSRGQLRLRIVDSRRIDPATLMPPYGAIYGLTRVGTAWQGNPILTPQEVEDVVAFLATLEE